MLAKRLGRLSVIAPTRRAVVRGRVAAVAAALSSAESFRGEDPVARLAELISDQREGALWLASAGISGELPLPGRVRRLRRSLELDGPRAALESILRSVSSSHLSGTVAIVEDRILIDVTGLLPGEATPEGQAIARRLVREWAELDAVILVTWRPDRRSLRALSTNEARELGSGKGVDYRNGRAPSLVPHRSRYVVAGVVDHPVSAERLIGLGRYSINPSASVGFGLGPLIERDRYPSSDGPGRFSWHVAAQRSFDSLVAMGDIAATHYGGWATMLSAIGVVGPRVSVFTPPPIDQTGDPRFDRAGTDPTWTTFSRDVGVSANVW